VPPEQARQAYVRINGEHWARFERGEITAGELKLGRFRALLDFFGLPADPTGLSRVYLEALSAKAFFLPHAREVLEELSRRAALCLITNGLTLVQRGRIRAPAWGALSAILISEEVGKAGSGFRLASEALALPASELLCVGDNPTADIGGRGGRHRRTAGTTRPAAPGRAGSRRNGPSRICGSCWVSRNRGREAWQPGIYYI
jgi:FMN phosphatase YigB (HAD superfamily)